jgi:hypothetical protein
VARSGCAAGCGAVVLIGLSSPSLHLPSFTSSSPCFLDLFGSLALLSSSRYGRVPTSLLFQPSSSRLLLFFHCVRGARGERCHFRLQRRVRSGRPGNRLAGPCCRAAPPTAVEAELAPGRRFLFCRHRGSVNDGFSVCAVVQFCSRAVVQGEREYGGQRRE